MSHPLDIYAAYTDLDALIAHSGTPLRKCFRVNTLKTTVKNFQAGAKKKGWALEPVPWCPEGFFIDREDRTAPLGKDLRHLLGYVYMQEASSMLPPILLNPQPGEVVLDMSAAPGSKTTQMAAMMNNQGIIMANDPTEKRLWTLVTALHRLGIVNTVVTKQMGQWFGKNMGELFDRVLCDAPCTAQGTVRKDPSALKYTSERSIEKAARIQRELLEAAIHACKVGGRIVYSTCTLTPEENEQVVLAMLKKFPTQLEVVDVSDEDLGMKKGTLKQAMKDSITVQENSKHPMLRIWPHTYDSEGFFCAVLTKTARTREPDLRDAAPQRERLLKRKEQKAVEQKLDDFYGTTFLKPGERLLERADNLYLTSEMLGSALLPIHAYSIGLPFAKGLTGSRFRLVHDLITLRGNMTQQHLLDVTGDDAKDLLHGKDISCPEEEFGDLILRFDNLCIGTGLAKKGHLKNRISRWVVGHHTS